jgi:hypothetical protein
MTHSLLSRFCSSAKATPYESQASWSWLIHWAVLEVLVLSLVELVMLVLVVLVLLVLVLVLIPAELCPAAMARP